MIKNKKYTLLIQTILITLIAAGCMGGSSKPEDMLAVPHTIVDVYRVEQVGTLLSWNPKYKAVLDNGDTVICSSDLTKGDTIYYYYVNSKK